ncbi:hypothetical protein PKOR_15405 [Pontibacter korlensis]|uniref:Uncharacterized protein n=1 Tax=Pontibacter korlensis TaxID=400092 RepID=A0A0E3ZFA8_9BACT|nr:hypothetical protein [Pontibacter korlensis]AKD04218.1 hypothetical protein PKOR_15405 [Pontibacter korlensis]
MAGCGDSDAEDTPAPEEEDPEYSIERSFKTHYDMIVTISGSKGVVVDFGKNELGTNPSVFKLGDSYFKDLVKVGKNKYQGKVVKSTTRWSNSELNNVLQSITYVDTDIEVDESGIDVSAPNSWDIIWNVVTSPTGGGTPGGFPGGGTGTSACPVGKWATPTCNGNKSLIYYFGANGEGYSENPDCNGICTSMIFRFKYTVSGNKITYNFTSTDNVTCYGSTSKPAVPTGTHSITFTCTDNGNKLITEYANIQTGARTTSTWTKVQ